MTKQIMLSMLRQGTTGEEILQILDTITTDDAMMEDEGGTLEPIDF
jgi:hypothetical protein